MGRKRMLRVVSWLLILSMVFIDLPANTVRIAAATGDAVVQVLNASTLEAAKLTEDLTQDGFTIKATSAKTVTIDGSEKTSEYNHSFTKRLKMGGAGDAGYRSIDFTTSSAGAVVTIYALSSSGTEDRTLTIYDASGNAVASKLTAYGESNITDVDGKIPAIKVTLGDAGTYNLRPDKSINIYYVSVCEGTDAETDFSDGTKPSVKSVVKNEADENLLDVTVSGTIANADTDRLWVKMYDASGKLADSAKVTALTDGEATVKLTPGDKGTYSFVCEAIRGGTKTTYKSDSFSYDFVPGLTKVEISSILTNGDGGLDVTWPQAVSATSYDVSVAAQGTDNFTDVETGISFTTDSYTVSIPNTLVSVGSTYTIKVTAYDAKGKSVFATMDKKVKASAERFKTALVGSGASGTFSIDEDNDTITMAAVAVGSGSGGKLADSEDGFLYYYTEINPEKENFTLTATFTVIDSASKDNQSGFGVMAIDDFIEGNSAARYFNSAGCMIRKYTKTVDGNIVNLYGAPGGYFVTGYTDATTVSSASRKLIDTAPFDWNWKADYTTATSSNPPKFEDGEEYTLTLKKDNTGFHAIMDGYDEIICYEPDLLLQQDKDKYYVGVAVSRKITVEVSNMQFTTSDPSTDAPGEARPETTVNATVSYDSATTASSSDFEAAFKANYVGTIDVYNSENELVVDDLKVDPRNDDTFRPVSMLKLTEGSNSFKAVYTPAEDSEQGDLLTATENLDQTPITVNFTVTYKQYGTSDNAIYVSANGSSANKGTKSSPLDVYTAVAYAQPGQEIVLLAGTYNLTKKIEVERGHNGTAAQPITIMSEPGTRVKLNLANSSSGGLVINGDYWYIYDFELYNGQGNQKVVQVTGNHNIVEKVTVHDNGYTGIQISGNAEEPFSMWPANNLILSCESYNNCDPLANDADGFAAKLTVGEGNVFRYCISHNNIDDGWDLYAKSTTGLIGEVTIDQCVAYDNGHLTADSGNTVTGEGNGFKLGGESMPVAHKLVNSVSFNNLANGTFSNSNPSCQISNVTSYDNKGQNLQLNTNATTTTWGLSNFISYGTAGKPDSMDLKNQSSLLSVTNYIDGKNSAGASVTDDWFVNLDTSVLPEIAEDGSIDMHGLLVLTDAAPSGVGAVISANPNPTVIEVGREIGESETPVTSETPSVEPSTSTAPSVEPSASTAPSVAPSASTAPSVEPSASTEPSVAPTTSAAPEVSESPSPSPSQTTSVAKPVFTKNLDSSVSYTYATGDKAATLSVSAKGKGLTYQWYYNTSASYSGATKISGATGKTYTPSTSKVSSRYYFVKVTSHDDTKDIKTAAVNSNRVKVVVKKVLTKAARPKITLNLLKNSNGTMKTYSYYAGDKATTLKVAATGKKISYQWYSNTSASYAGATKIAGATSAVYKPSTAKKGSKYYFVKIYNTDNTKDIKRVTGYSRIVKVTVKKAVTSIKCDNITIKAGKTRKLAVTVLPTDASNKQVTYKSSNTKYATVSATGVVTAKKAGKGKTVTITVTSKDNSKVVKKVKVTIQ